MESEISLKMKAIHGTLEYRKGSRSYKIPVEHTGDYKQGLLVFLSRVEPQISDEDKRAVLSELRKDLKTWAKETNQPICW